MLGTQMHDIDRRSPLPLYYQLAQILRKGIQSGAINQGDRLPSERELTEHFGVSRNTVRQAMELLISDGLVHREHGRGSFAMSASLGIQCKLDTFVEHAETLRQAGYEPEVVHIGMNHELPNKIVQTALALEDGEAVTCFTKLFLADGQPAILTYDYLPAHILGEYPDETGAGKAFFEFLEAYCGVRPEFILADIEPTAALDQVATHFQCPEGTLLLLLKEQFLDPGQETPLAFAYNYYHPEIVHFQILRRRQ